MTTFIAMRRKPRTETFGLEALSVADRRSALVEGAPRSERSSQLLSIGLRQVQPEERASEDLPTFQRLGNVGAYVVDTPHESQADEARQILGDDYAIVPNIPLALPKATLGDTHLQRGRRKQFWPEDSGIAAARANGATGQGVLVGVLDTGCDADHIEFVRKRVDFRYVPLKPQPDAIRAVRGFDVGGHGTHVCGIIAGRHVGVAPDAELMVASVIESESVRTSLERITIALDWMLSQFEREENLEKPTIISMSLGFLPEWLTQGQISAAIAGIQILLTTLVVDFDVLPVVAIGNDGAGVLRLPGAYGDVLAVGSIDSAHQPDETSGGGISTFTAGPKPDIAGYGVDIFSSFERDVDRRSWYARMSGTSMAAPYVTGIAALYASAHVGLVGSQLRQRVIDNVLPLAHPPERVGAGLARFV